MPSFFIFFLPGIFLKIFDFLKFFLCHCLYYREAFEQLQHFLKLVSEKPLSIFTKKASSQMFDMVIKNIKGTYQGVRNFSFLEKMGTY